MRNLFYLTAIGAMAYVALSEIQPLNICWVLPIFCP